MPSLAQSPIRLSLADAIARGFENSHRLAEARAREEGREGGGHVRRPRRQADVQRQRRILADQSRPRLWLSAARRRARDRVPGHSGQLHVAPVVPVADLHLGTDRRARAGGDRRGAGRRRRHRDHPRRPAPGDRARLLGGGDGAGGRTRARGIHRARRGAGDATRGSASTSA